MRLGRILILALLFLTQAAFAAMPPPRPAPVEVGVTQDIVSIATGDGVQLPGVLSYPGPTLNTGAPAILHLPDGPGMSAMRSADTGRFAATAFAHAGFANFTLEPRYEQSYSFSHFDDAINDVRAAVDLLAARGFTNVVIAGHGLGALLATRYMAETDDARVKAVILFAPSPDLAPALRARLGDTKYLEDIDAASKALNEPGRGDFIDLGGGLIFTPVAFLDWFGPTAKTSLTANIASVNRPMFLAAGDRDPTVPKGRLEQLKGLAFAAKQSDLKYYAGAGHDFSGARDQVTADALKWLAGLGLAAPPRVIETLVDAVAKDGTPLVGVLYSPATGAEKDKPTFILLHGWTGDIMRSSSQWLGQRLAQRGYTALAIQTRDSGFRGVVTGRLEETPPDIGAWVDFMAGRGYRNLIAEGHSTGGLLWSYYLNQTKDERIKGVVYLAPMRDMPKHARLAMGEDRYARAVLEAEDAVRAGKGATTLIDMPFPQPAYDEDPRQPMHLPLPGSGFTYYYANAFLSYWGPASKAVHTQLVATVKVPILALGGSRDPLMQGAFLIDFTEAAGKKATYVFYGGPQGATNSFEGYEGRVADDILAWLAKTLHR